MFYPTITGGGGPLNTMVEGGTEGGGALNTAVEGGEAKASLEILPRGSWYASSAEAGGCLTDAGSETIPQSDAIETAGIDNGSGPTAGIP